MKSIFLSYFYYMHMILLSHFLSPVRLYLSLSIYLSIYLFIYQREEARLKRQKLQEEKDKKREEEKERKRLEICPHHILYVRLSPFILYQVRMVE